MQGPTRLTELLDRVSSGRAVWRWLNARGWLELDAREFPGNFIGAIDGFWDRLRAARSAEPERRPEHWPPDQPWTPRLGGRSPAHELAEQVEEFLTDAGLEAMRAAPTRETAAADARSQRRSAFFERFRPAPRALPRRSERERVRDQMRRALARLTREGRLPSLEGGGVTVQLPGATVAIVSEPDIEGLRVTCDNGSLWQASADAWGRMEELPHGPLPRADADV